MFVAVVLNSLKTVKNLIFLKYLIFPAISHVEDKYSILTEFRKKYIVPRSGTIIQIQLFILQALINQYSNSLGDPSAFSRDFPNPRPQLLISTEIHEFLKGIVYKEQLWGVDCSVH
jgi:hypothetical protein